MLQGNSAVRQEIGVTVIDLEEIGRFESSGKINPVQHEVAAEKISKEQRDSSKGEGAHPPFTDWSRFDRGQIWEIYQGLVNGIDV